MATSFRNTNLLTTLSHLVPQIDPEYRGVADKATISSTQVPTLEKVIVFSEKPQNRSVIIIFALIAYNSIMLLYVQWNPALARFNGLGNPIFNRKSP